MDEGTQLEYRIDRLFFHNNYFSRRSIPLKNYFYPDDIDITDIDVLGIRYSVDFSMNRIIADCKSNISLKSRDAKPANRILWLSGLKNFLNCDLAYFCKPEIKKVMKDFALKNEIVPIDYKKLEELEDKFNIKDVWEGSYDTSNYSKLVSHYNNIKISKDLSQVYWFLRMEFWVSPSNLQIKRCVNYASSSFKDKEITMPYEKYLLGESYILSSLALLNICKDTYPYTQSEREMWITNKMIEGIGTIEQQEKFLKLMRSYTQAKVEELTQQKVSITREEFKMIPPDYTKDLIELVNRFIDKAEYSIEVPRFLDFFIYEYILNSKEIDNDRLSSLFKTDVDIVAKLSKNLIKFVDPLAQERKMNTKLLEY
jgi:hypothetical protein